MCDMDPRSSPAMSASVRATRSRRWALLADTFSAVSVLINPARVVVLSAHLDGVISRQITIQAALTRQLPFPGHGDPITKPRRTIVCGRCTQQRLGSGFAELHVEINTVH